MPFFNTCHVRGQRLAEYEFQTGKQEAVILDFFNRNPGAKVTPEDVMRYHPRFQRTPITSIRRAFSNLNNAGYIEKLDEQVDGMYGKPIYLWRLRQALPPQQEELCLNLHLQ